MKKLARQAIEFFFRFSNLVSWEAGFEGEDIPDKPDYKVIEFQDGDFHLRQEYSVYGVLLPQFVTTKVISYQGKPVWKMTCSGLYHKGTAEFLSRALFRNHSRGIFTGGRGPVHFILPDHPEDVYENVMFLHKFGNFSGHDKVHFNVNGPNKDGMVSSKIFSHCNYYGGFIPGSILAP